MPYALIFAAVLLSCATPKDTPSDVMDHWTTHDSAKNEDSRPKIIYWGAAWCPPCNELKDRVFSHKDFDAATQPFRLVYLDGDHPEAQQLGEQYGASGYPTLLILSPEGVEVARANTAMSFDDFRTFLSASLLALSGDQPAMIKRALVGKATQKDWEFLAHIDWNGSPEDSLYGVKTLEQLWAHVPRKTPLGAKFASALWSAKKGCKKLCPAVTHDELMVTILASPETTLAAHSVIAYGAADIPEGSQRRAAWRQAASFLSRNTTLSYANRLGMINALIDIDGPSPAALRRTDELITEMSSHRLKPYEIQAAYPEAGYLMFALGEKDRAVEWLAGAAESSPSPFYFYSMLAYVERKSGDIQAALQWAHKATQTAQGSATKIQWTSSELVLAADHKDHADENKLDPLIDQFYDELFDAPDGFWGRNHRRQLKVSAALQKRGLSAKQKQRIKPLELRCEKLTSKLAQERCSDHFKILGI